MKKLIVFFALLGLARGATMLRMACGGSGGTDAQGNVWVADASFTGGARWDAANQAAMASMPVPYRSLRYATSFSYTLTLPAGAYNVTLKFLEPNKTGGGQRIFGVSVNGSQAIAGLDLFSAAGVLHAYDRTFAATSNGQIRIDLSATAGNAVLSAIQVDSVPEVPLSTVSYLAGLESAPPACPAAGVTLFAALDTGHLSWCAAGGPWMPVGGKSGLASLEQCSGSGDKWDCAGMLHASITRADGSTLSIVGVQAAASPGVMWSALK